MSATERWSLILADFAASLDELEQLIADGEMALDSPLLFEAPADTPPLPADMVPYAAALLERSAAVELALLAARADVEAALDDLSTRPRHHQVSAAGASLDRMA